MTPRIKVSIKLISDIRRVNISRRQEWKSLVSERIKLNAAIQSGKLH